MSTTRGVRLVGSYASRKEGSAKAAKITPAFIVTVLLATMFGCGSGARGVSSRSVTVENGIATARASNGSAAAKLSGIDRDGDRDSNGDSFYDADDSSLLAYGRAASPAETAAMGLAVKRYYAAVATGNGGLVCSLIYPLFAESIVETYEQSGEAHSQRTDTCAHVVSQLVRQRYQRIARAHSIIFRTIGARVDGDRAYALLSHGNLPERAILLRREAGIWKLDELIDEGLP
jgi:hypothetical protein